MSVKASIVVAFLIVSAHLQAQRNDSLSYREQFALLEAEMDSMSVYLLFDSLLGSLKTPHSELIPRFGYNSNVLNFGRNYGLQQHGFSPGVSFYHKSGFFADYIGFWNNSLNPNYNLTIFSSGYMGTLGMKWNYTGTYEKWIYHDSESSIDNSLTNSLGGSITFNTKFLYANLDYSYLFGRSEGAHRIIGSVSGNLNLSKWWIFSKISILPTFSSYFGNQKVIIRYEGSLLEEIRTNEYLRQNIGSDQLTSLLTQSELDQIERVRQNDGRFARARILNIYFSNQDVVNYLFSILDEEKSSYGIMNYTVSLPIMFSINKFNLILSYTYSIPVQLPEEQIKLDPVGYFGASVSYRISFKD